MALTEGQKEKINQTIDLAKRLIRSQLGDLAIDVDDVMVKTRQLIAALEALRETRG